MTKSIHVLLAGSIPLLAHLSNASPLDLLLGGGPKAKAANVPAAAYRKLGDSELSCAALYAEARQLEAQAARPQGDAPAASSGEATKGIVAGLAQSLLNAAPMFGGGERGGMIAGMVAQQAAQQLATNQAVQATQQGQQAQMDATASQRREHLMNLFEGKRCKVSEPKK